MSQLDTDREFWKCASRFPADKEAVYPAHAVVQQFDLHTGKVVVEYGCGGGSDTASWARRGNAVRALDIVPGNVDTTRERLGRELPDADVRVTCLEASAPIPLDDASADVVSCHGVLHHIAPPTHGIVLGEFARVLRPGGLLYLMLYTEHLFARGEAAMAGYPADWTTERRFSYFTDGGGWARSYTEAQGVELIESFGLKVLDAPIWNSDDFRTFQAVKP